MPDEAFQGCLKLGSGMVSGASHAPKRGELVETAVQGILSMPDGRVQGMVLVSITQRVESGFIGCLILSASGRSERFFSEKRRQKMNGREWRACARARNSRMGA